MCNAIEVEGIAVMGSVALKQFDKIIPSKKEIEEYCINPIPEITPTKLGKEIGLLGAYFFGLEKIK